MVPALGWAGVLEHTNHIKPEGNPVGKTFFKGCHRAIGLSFKSRQPLRLRTRSNVFSLIAKKCCCFAWPLLLPSCAAEALIELLIGLLIPGFSYPNGDAFLLLKYTQNYVKLERNDDELLCKNEIAVESWISVTKLRCK